MGKFVDEEIPPTEVAAEEEWIRKHRDHEQNKGDGGDGTPKPRARIAPRRQARLRKPDWRLEKLDNGLG